MKICALIPVYNNAATIGDVVARCRVVMDRDVLVVADGPTDGSDERARQTGVRVVALPENQGKGAAIARGLEEAGAAGYTHAIVLDADGQHMPEDIPKFIEAVEGAPDRLWVGVRRMEPGSTPVASRRGRAVSNFWTTLNGWQRCRDAQCGFRAYPIETTLGLGCRETGFAFEMEVVVRASWAGVKIDHVNIDVSYPGPGETRVSHFDPGMDNIRASWLSFRMFWQMLARSPVLAARKLRGR